MKLINKTNGNFLAENLEIADTITKRMKGLLGRHGLAGGEGLHIIPCSSIHSFFMKFTFDAIFIDKENKVIDIIENMPPANIKFCFRAHSVVELPAGSICATNIKIGDKVDFME